MNAPLTRAPTTQEMARAFAGKDATYDGVFVVAVRSTRIFCRPSCPARRPRPENVRFFTSSIDALGAGFRPCRRCQPLEIPGAQPDWIEHLTNQLRTPPGRRWTDDDLRAAGIEPARARRHFTTQFGLTFQAYQRGYLLGRALQQLKAGRDMTQVALEAGFDSLSGFRDAFARAFDAPPGEARTTPCIYVDTISTSVGMLTAGATDDGVALLEFPERDRVQRQLLKATKRLRAPALPGAHEHLARLRGQLDEYFAGARREFDLPLATAGTPFQESVWSELTNIPFGETISYAQLATCIGRPGASRAVGRANGENRLAILLPCHRVVAADGKLCGYGGGLWRKQWLLDHERGVSA